MLRVDGVCGGYWGVTGFWKHPLLPIGLLVFVIGTGNWWVSRGKIAEYSQRMAVASGVDISDRQGLTYLDERTNASLLRRLHGLPADSGFAGGKRDFYMLVNNGGRLIAIVGFALFSVGAVRYVGGRRKESHDL